MHITKILAIFGIMLFITGCVPSLHPLFTEKDLVFEPALVGTWAGGEGSEETWVFQKEGEKSYGLTYTAEGEPAKFKVHLINLGGLFFMDIYPEGLYEGDKIKNNFYLCHMIQTHTFSKIEIKGDVLRIAMLDYDWLKEMLDNKKIDITHERLGDESNPMIVLTASTKELQGFVLKYAIDKKAFPEPMELHRQK